MAEMAQITMSSDIKNPGGRVLIKKEKYQNRATFDIGG
jgi:hypothetical protein